MMNEILPDSQLRPDVAWFRRELGISLAAQIPQLNYYCRPSSQWKRTRRGRREFYLHYAISQRLVNWWSEYRNSKGTHKKNDITLDKICSWNGWNCTVPNNPTRRWDHGQEGSENSLRFLDLVEIDRGIDERDQDQDAAEVSILEVGLCFDGNDGLWWAMKMKLKIVLTWKLIPRRTYSSTPAIMRRMLNIVNSRSRN